MCAYEEEDLCVLGQLALERIHCLFKKNKKIKNKILGQLALERIHCLFQVVSLSVILLLDVNVHLRPLRGLEHVLLIQGLDCLLELLGLSDVLDDGVQVVAVALQCVFHLRLGVRDQGLGVCCFRV